MAPSMSEGLRSGEVGWSSAIASKRCAICTERLPEDDTLEEFATECTGCRQWFCHGTGNGTVCCSSYMEIDASYNPICGACHAAALPTTPACFLQYAVRQRTPLDATLSVSLQPISRALVQPLDDLPEDDSRSRRVARLDADTVS